MRLPNSIVPNSPTQVTTSNIKMKRDVIVGDSCNPPVIKNTPYIFERRGETGFGLAMGNETIYLDRPFDYNTINLAGVPNMTALRQTFDFMPADASSKGCKVQDFDVAAGDIDPKYVLSPEQTLHTYTYPSNVKANALIWKLTPYFVENAQYSFIANGTQDVYGPGSSSLNAAPAGLTMADFPIQLALRPVVDYVVETSNRNDPDAGAPVLTALAPTDVVTLMPLQTSYDLSIMSFLGIATTAPSVATTVPVPSNSLAGDITAVRPSATLVASPTATLTGPPAHTGHRGVSDGVIAGTVVGSLVGLALVGAIGRMAYKKIQSMREDAKMGDRIKQWSAKHAIELDNLDAPAPTGDISA